MSEKSPIEFTFCLSDPDLEDDEKVKFAKNFLRQLKESDEVEEAERTEDLNPEAGSRPGFATLIGYVTAKVSVDHLKEFMGFLKDRLQDKSLEVSVKVGEEEVTLKANSQAEIDKLEATALSLMAKMGSSGHEEA